MRIVNDEDLHKPVHEPYKRSWKDWHNLLLEEVDEHFEDEEADEETL